MPGQLDLGAAMPPKGHASSCAAVEAAPPEVAAAQAAWAAFRRGDAEALKVLRQLAHEQPSACALVLLAKAELLRVVERVDQAS